MANGFLAKFDNRVYYVQHTAAHPIADRLAREWLDRLIEVKLPVK